MVVPPLPFLPFFPPPCPCLCPYPLASLLQLSYQCLPFRWSRHRPVQRPHRRRRGKRRATNLRKASSWILLSCESGAEIRAAETRCLASMKSSHGQFLFLCEQQGHPHPQHVNGRLPLQRYRSNSEKGQVQNRALEYRRIGANQRVVACARRTENLSTGRRPCRGAAAPATRIPDAPRGRFWR